MVVELPNPAWSQTRRRTGLSYGREPPWGLHAVGCRRTPDTPSERSVNVTIDQQPEDILATVTGEMDADNCAEFSSAILSCPTDSGRVVVDLAGLTFIDSSGISELLRVDETLDERGQALVLKNPSPAVRRVLEITGLLDHFGLS